jgi:hypothetical protein
MPQGAKILFLKFSSKSISLDTHKSLFEMLTLLRKSYQHTSKSNPVDDALLGGGRGGLVEQFQQKPC